MSERKKKLNGMEHMSAVVGNEPCFFGFDYVKKEICIWIVPYVFIAPTDG